MIDHFDTLLLCLCRRQVNEFCGNGRVCIQSPDEDWRAPVPGINDAVGNRANSLNVYVEYMRGLHARSPVRLEQPARKFARCAGER